MARNQEKNRLREVRDDCLLTQAELAKESGVGRRTIVSIEQGMRCRVDTKRKLLHALGLVFSQKNQVWPLEDSP